MMMIWNNGWAWWQGGLMWLAMIAFWALVVWLIAGDSPSHAGNRS